MPWCGKLWGECIKALKVCCLLNIYGLSGPLSNVEYGVWPWCEIRDKFGDKIGRGWWIYMGGGLSPLTNMGAAAPTLASQGLIWRAVIFCLPPSQPTPPISPGKAPSMLCFFLWKFKLAFIIANSGQMMVPSGQDDILTENIWFVWSSTSYGGLKWRCRNSERTPEKGR